MAERVLHRLEGVDSVVFGLVLSTRSMTWKGQHPSVQLLGWKVNTLQKNRYNLIKGLTHFEECVIILPMYGFVVRRVQEV